MNRPINHHVVPRFVLANFVDERGFIHVRDKRTGREWKSKPEKTFIERRFNEAEHHEHGVLDLEPRYAEIESFAAPVVKRLLDGDAPMKLPPDDRVTLCIFVAIQQLRSPNWRAVQLSLSRQQRSMFPDGRMPASIVEQIGTLTDQEARFESVALVTSLAREILPYLLNKFWFLSTAYPGTEFLVGDSPVVLYNSIEYPFRGNLGLEVPGCELHFPIAPTIMLSAVAPDLAARIAVKSSGMQRCIKTGARIRLSPDNMLFQNSLQVRWSERLIAGRQGDFAIVNRMIRDNPAFKSGMRMQTYRGNDELPEIRDWTPEVVSPDSLRDPEKRS